MQENQPNDENPAISGDETNVTLIAGISDMLCEGLMSVDPEVVAAAHTIQQNYFDGMGADDLSLISARLQSYTADEKRVCAQLLMLAEREVSQSYQSWIAGRSPSNLHPVVVRNAIFAVPALVGLEVPIQEPNKVAKGVYALFESVPEESADVYVGRLVLEEVTGESLPDSDLHHLAWLSKNIDALLPHMDHFRLIRSIDRQTCDSVLNGASALSNGAL